MKKPDIDPFTFGNSNGAQKLLKRVYNNSYLFKKVSSFLSKYCATLNDIKNSNLKDKEHLLQIYFHNRRSVIEDSDYVPYDIKYMKGTLKEHYKKALDDIKKEGETFVSPS